MLTMVGVLCLSLQAVAGDAVPAPAGIADTADIDPPVADMGAILSFLVPDHAISSRMFCLV